MAKNNRERVYKTYCISVADVEVQKYLEELKKSGERAASNVAGIHEFDKGTNLKIHLKMGANDWKLEVFSGDEKIKDIPKGSLEAMRSAFSEAILQSGHSDNDTILCNFFFDATEAGTASAYKETRSLFDSIKLSYENFYISETDTSIFTEELS